MTLIYKYHNGREIWARWDKEAKIYELFASNDGSDYLGCADTLTEARKLALVIANDEDAEY